MELDAQFGKLTMASNATDAVKQRDLPYFSGLPRIRLPTEQQKAKKKKRKIERRYRLWSETSVTMKDLGPFGDFLLYAPTVRTSASLKNHIFPNQLGMSVLGQNMSYEL